MVIETTPNKCNFYKALSSYWNPPHSSIPSLISKLLYEEFLDHASQDELFSLRQTPVSFLISKTYKFLAPSA